MENTAKTNKALTALEINKEGNKALLFYRDFDLDRIVVEEKDFSPCILLAEKILAEGLPEGASFRELKGEGFYRYRIDFPSLGECESFARSLKAKTGFSPGGYGAPYRTFSDPVQQALTHFRIRLFEGMEFSRALRMQFDIETYCGTGHEFSNPEREEDAIIMISLSDNRGFEKVLSLEEYGGSEKALLEDFVKIVQEKDPDILEGHNIFRFDLPYITARAKRHKVKLSLGRDGSIMKSRSSRFSVGERIVQYTRSDIYGRHIVDTYMLLLFYDAVNRNLDSYGLKNAAIHFKIASPERTYIPGEMISRFWDEKKEELKKYALDDVREVKALSGILSPSFFYQSCLIPLSFQNTIVRGNATRIEALLAAKYLSADHALPLPERGRPFAGALTGAEHTGVFHEVEHCDVRSLYPSILLSRFEEGPARDSLGVFIATLKELRKFRLEAKDKAKALPAGEEKEYYDSLQKTFKILINSFYGYLGFEQGFLNDFSLAEKVTSTGRMILSSMMELLEKEGAKVIEMDTDGIYFVRCREKKEGEKSLEDNLRAILPAGIEVEFDPPAKAMFCYKSKNYAILSHDGTLSLTGAALKSRGLEPFQRAYMQKVISLLLEGKEEEYPLFHREMEEKIKGHLLPLRDLAKTETLADSPESYRKKITAGTSRRSAAYELVLASGRDYRQGDQVSFYITGEKKKVSIVENSRLLADAPAGERDENILFYLEKLQELKKKFAPFMEGTPSPCNEGVQEEFVLE